MTINKNAGVVLLSIWLVLTGLIELIGLNFANLGQLMGLLALVAGVVIVLDSSNLLRGKKSNRRVGWILLGAWLILTGLLALVDMAFAGLTLLLGLLALAAGVLILLDR
jgi:hypothetical protein